MLKHFFQKNYVYPKMQEEKNVQGEQKMLTEKSKSQHEWFT